MSKKRRIDARAIKRIDGAIDDAIKHVKLARIDMSHFLKKTDLKPWEAVEDEIGRAKAEISRSITGREEREDMSFYVVVRHPDTKGTFVNRWDGDRLLTITTTPTIGLRCIQAMERKERVFVHRCGIWKTPVKPTIVGSVTVESSCEQSDGKYLVEFGGHTMINQTPIYKPEKHENSYEL